MKRPLAYLTAAWSGEPDVDMELAAHYCRLAYEAGFSPICPLLYLPLFLNDSVPEEHKAGIDMRRDNEFNKKVEAALPHLDRLRQRSGRGCKKRYCGCRAAGHCGDHTGRGACREGTRHPGPCRTLSWEAFLTGSACSLWLLPGAVSVRYGPVRLKKRPSL